MREQSRSDEYLPGNQETLTRLNAQALMSTTLSKQQIIEQLNQNTLSNNSKPPSHTNTLKSSPSIEEHKQEINNDEKKLDVPDQPHTSFPVSPIANSMSSHRRALSLPASFYDPPKPGRKTKSKLFITLIIFIDSRRIVVAYR